MKLANQQASAILRHFFWRYSHLAVLSLVTLLM